AGRSRQSRGDRVAVGDDRQGPLELVAELEVGGDAEAAVDRGDDLGGGDRVGLGPGADLVAGAVDVARLDPAAGHPQAVAEVPVVAAGGGVDLRAAAELAHDDHQRPAEHPPGQQVVEQAGDGGVGLGHQRVLELDDV